RDRDQHPRARADRLPEPAHPPERQRGLVRLVQAAPVAHRPADRRLLFNTFLAVGPITMSVIVFVVGLQIWLFRSRWGLRTRAVGEHPRAADTVGIDVIRLRYRNVVLGGIFAGLAGAYLT